MAALAGTMSEGLFSRRLRATTAGLVLVITLSAFEAMAVATAMPTAVRELHGLAYYSWPFTAFLVASVVGTVASGEFSDRRGPRGPMLVGLAVFAVGLVVAGTAVSMAVFVVGRVVQGLGAGTVIVGVYVLIAEVYPDALRPRVFALTSAAWVLPSLLGPLVAGLLTAHLTWRLVFGGLAPFVALGLALLWPTLRRLPARLPVQREVAPRRTLVPFAVLAAVGLAAVQFAGQHLRPASLLPLAVGVALLVPALRRLLPAGTVRARRGLPAALAFRGILAGSFFGVDSFVPLTLTDLHHYSPAAAGVPLTLGALGWSAGSWWQGRSAAARHRLVAVGCALITLGAASLVCVAFARVPGLLAAPLWAVAGTGMGLAMPTVSVLLLELSDRDERGQNSAALQICDMLCSAVCVGLGGVLLAAVTAGRGATGPAIALIDLTMAAIAALGVIAAGRLRAGPVPPGGGGAG
ncbi:MAG TPA: MFS transporter [Mycobacteriales bacterium]|nr:MFS transporter [Mycobacteriales bacterium]